MKTIEFAEVEEKEANEYLVQRIEQTKGNGLFNMLQHGYSYHIPISIRPDDIANAVGCIWAKYIEHHAEELRSFFVSHEGKKKLTYYSGGTYSRERLQEFMNGLTSLIKEDQDNDNMSWLEPSMTTTTDVDHFIRSTAQLSSQKKYYEYGCVLCCGFPKITLLGEEEDWDAIEFLIQSMPAPDDGLEKWQKRLLNTVAGMRSDDEEFWQSCVTKHPYGSGGQAKIEGWILDFNPINEKGEWLTIVDEKDVLDLTVDFELAVDDNGHEFDVNVDAGPVQMKVCDNEISVLNSFSIVEVESKEKISIQA